MTSSGNLPHTPEARSLQVLNIRCFTVSRFGGEGGPALANVVADAARRGTLRWRAAWTMTWITLIMFCGWPARAAEQEEEPSFKGRRLSEWLADAAVPGLTLVGAPDPTGDAIRGMGTNIIPILLKWMAYDQSTNAVSITGKKVPAHVWHILDAEERADASRIAFRYLGASAQSAIPELTRTARTLSDARQAERYALALAAIGPLAIPSLAAFASNAPVAVQSAAILALESPDLRPEAAQIIPIFINALADPRTNAHTPATAAQGALFCMDEKLVVPALTNAMHNPSALVRKRAVECLIPRESDSLTAGVVLPVLSTALCDPDEQVREQATNTLRLAEDWTQVEGRWLRKSDGPVYKGRTLLEWMGDLSVDKPDYGGGPQVDAIRALGTNAVPALLQWISFQQHLPELTYNSRPPEFHSVSLPDQPMSRTERAERAGHALIVLGTTARPAALDLMKIALYSIDPECARRCAAVLSSMGPEAIPCLLSLTVRGLPGTRFYGVDSLERFTGEPGAAQIAPILATSLENTNRDWPIAAAAQRVLLSIDPALVVPALTNVLHSSTPPGQVNALKLMTMLGGKTPIPLSAVRAAMCDTNLEVRVAATNALLQLETP